MHIAQRREILDRKAHGIKQRDVARISAARRRACDDLPKLRHWKIWVHLLNFALNPRLARIFDKDS